MSVPGRRAACPGRLGHHDVPGWTVVKLSSIAAVLEHFTATNYIQVGSLVGRECRGVPMGDALSNAALRLFKWKREREVATLERISVVRLTSTHTQLIHLNGSNLLALDVSFRDDVRLFCCWDPNSGLQANAVQVWANARLRHRYHNGSMQLEPSDPDLFVGVHTYWSDNQLECRAKFNDPWAVSFYSLADSCPLKPWCSWAPACQHKAAMVGIFSRCFYLSSSTDAFVLALLDSFGLLIRLASFPKDVVFSKVLAWAKCWRPKTSRIPVPFLLKVCLVERAIQLFVDADRN